MFDDVCMVYGIISTLEQCPNIKWVLHVASSGPSCYCYSSHSLATLELGSMGRTDMFLIVSGRVASSWWRLVDLFVCMFFALWCQCDVGHGMKLSEIWGNCEASWRAMISVQTKMLLLHVQHRFIEWDSTNMCKIAIIWILNVWLISE